MDDGVTIEAIMKWSIFVKDHWMPETVSFQGKLLNPFTQEGLIFQNKIANPHAVFFSRIENSVPVQKMILSISSPFPKEVSL